MWAQQTRGRVSPGLLGAPSGKQRGPLGAMAVLLCGLSHGRRGSRQGAGAAAVRPRSVSSVFMGDGREARRADLLAVQQVS